MKAKRITRTRYYCDFCAAEGRRKGFWTKPSIVKHERGCTANPNRVCGICAAAIPELKQKPIAELLACIDINKSDYGMKELREVAENCPGCILAAIRQSGIQKCPDGESPRWFERPVEFNFKQELQCFWDEVNNIHVEREAQY